MEIIEMSMKWAHIGDTNKTKAKTLPATDQNKLLKAKTFTISLNPFAGVRERK